MKGRTKRTIGLTGGALALASLGFKAYRVANAGVRIQAEQDFGVPASAVIDLIRQVEKEPEMVPFVSRTDVIDRQDDEITYEVGSNTPVPWRAVYRKWWDYDQKWVAWKSLTGTFGLSHAGEIRFKDTPGGCRASLITYYHFSTPLVGGPATLTSEIMVQAAMSGWLKRLSLTLERAKTGKRN